MISYHSYVAEQIHKM